MNDPTSSVDRGDLRRDHLLDHSYDGIEEFDKPLPRWWVLLFWVTIVATPLYILYFHFGPGSCPSSASAQSGAKPTPAQSA